MTTIDSRYEGALRCHSSHGPSASVLETDAPTDNQGKGERFSPTDLVATALSTCILTILGSSPSATVGRCRGPALGLKKP